MSQSIAHERDDSQTFLTGARIDENKRYGSIDENQLDNIENMEAIVDENIRKQGRLSSNLSFKKPLRERNGHQRFLSQSVCMTPT